MSWWGDRKRKKRGDSTGSSVLEGAGEVAAGCSGCGIDLVIAITVIAGLPLLIWSI